nr:MAG TPA: LTP1, LTP1BP, LIPID TRANSPORT-OXIDOREDUCTASE complex [Bacteriophage sp.]
MQVIKCFYNFYAKSILCTIFQKCGRIFRCFRGCLAEILLL